MTIRNVLNEAAKSLHVESPRKEASLLLAYFLKCDRTWLLMHEDNDLKDFDGYMGLIKRRANNEPFEYITGEASFYSRDFFIDEGVLIPRPETEILVDKAYEIIKDIQNPRIVEIGVGSGIISTMLGILKKDAKIFATDISEKALQNAKKNFEKFDVKVELVHTSLLDNIVGEFDLLVSNPPYIANTENLEEHVLKEPHTALFGGEVGDELLHQIIFTCKEKNIPNLACEIGYDQRESMQICLEKANAKEIKFYKDLAGLDRGFIAKF